MKRIAAPCNFLQELVNVGPSRSVKIMGNNAMCSGPMQTRRDLVDGQHCLLTRVTSTHPLKARGAKCFQSAIRPEISFHRKCLFALGAGAMHVCTTC